MRLCIVTFSKSGAKIARQLKRVMPEVNLYLKEELVVEGKEQVLRRPFRAFVGEIFGEYDGLIFIMATGIVIREIAPYLINKKVDPAVVVIDDLGQFVISLLSGHLRGANELTRQIASILGATPVITTSTDLHQVPAFDLLAQRWGMKIERADQLKYISGALIDGGMIGVFTDFPLPDLLSNQVQVAGRVSDLLVWEIEKVRSHDSRWSGVVLVTDVAIPDTVIEELNLPVIILRPRSLVVGMGFRRGKDAEELTQALLQVCTMASVSVHSIAKIVTIDLKANEPGIIQLCAELDIPLEIYSTDEVRQVEEQFPTSDFVKQVVGVGAVAEPCTFLGTVQGKWVLRKQRLNGITVAIMRECSAMTSVRDVGAGEGGECIW